MPNILIASAKVPAKGAGVKFLHQLRDCAAEDGVVVVGGLIVEGPGCVNYAINVEPHADLDNFANHLTMALMPAKWNYTQDPVPVGEWTDGRSE
jgi:hypothetical protein